MWPFKKRRNIHCVDLNRVVDEFRTRCESLEKELDQARKHHADVQMKMECSRSELANSCVDLECTRQALGIAEKEIEELVNSNKSYRNGMRASLDMVEEIRVAFDQVADIVRRTPINLGFPEAMVSELRNRDSSMIDATRKALYDVITIFVPASDEGVLAEELTKESVVDCLAFRGVAVNPRQISFPTPITELGLFDFTLDLELGKPGILNCKLWVVPEVSDSDL